MSNEVTNGELMQMLIQISNQSAANGAKVDGLSTWLTKHVADDKLMADDIKALTMSSARQKGFLSALAGAGGLLGAGVGYAIDLISRGHH
jgi:hypothetical protein